MSIDTKQLKIYIVIPVLQYIDLYSPSAQNLILGTCAQESKMGTYIKQMGFNVSVTGGALGIYQMELATAKDIIINFLQYKKELFDKIDVLYTGGSLKDITINKENEDILKCLAYNLIGNLLFSTAMCRLHYLRIKESLPIFDDVFALGKYWKKYYNTDQGKGTVEEFMNNYKIYVENV